MPRLVPRPARDADLAALPADVVDQIVGGESITAPRPAGYLFPYLTIPLLCAAVLSSCGKNVRTAASLPVVEGETAPAPPKPAGSAETRVAGASGHPGSGDGFHQLSDSHRAVSSLRTACERLLDQYEGTCAPADCEASILKDAHGVRVHQLTLYQRYCEDACEAVGILGEPLYVPWGNDCPWPSTSSSSESFILIESLGRFWPAVNQKNWYGIWAQETQSIGDIAISDSEHLAWTETFESVEIIEPDGGLGGAVRKSSITRRHVRLSHVGPCTAHVRLLSESVQDDVAPARYEGEDDESLARRVAAYQRSQQEADAVGQPFETDPLPDPLPSCEPF